MYYYAITIRKVELPAFHNHYELEKWILANKYPHAKFVWHYEDTHGLHMHGMIETPKRMYVNKIHPGKGWNIDFQQVKNEAAWKCYIAKDSKKEQEVIKKAIAEEQEFYTDPRQQSQSETTSVSSDSEEYIENSEIYQKLKTKNIFLA